MANLVNTNPMVLDTAGAVSTDKVTVKAVVFTAANGEGLLLSDKEGNPVVAQREFFQLPQ